MDYMVVRHGTLKCKYTDMQCQLDASPVFILFIEKMWVVEYKTLKVYTCLKSLREGLGLCSGRPQRVN